MCGIAGFIDGRMSASDGRGCLDRMLASIAHRGPDDSGAWLDAQVAIGHRRLSIVDLSPQGHQPMLSASERFVLAFNGEIYNHRSLRKDLEKRGHAFRGRSDTEVLLVLVEEDGLEAALRQCVGMFAIVLWDQRERTLQLARDRFGEKPLYYGWHSGAFVFGSELKALAAYPGFQRSVDCDSLLSLLKFGYIPSPHTIYRATSKVCPGAILTLHLPMEQSGALTAEDCGLLESRYWSHEQVLTEGLASPFTGTFAQAADELEALLTDAVGLQMQADVPLGAFLSGGVDSSTIVALMQRLSSRPVRTYSIGFEIDSHNEAEHAKKVAGHLGTAHSELYVSSADVLNVVPHLPAMYDEPLGDSSQIPTYLVAKLARSEVTVSLSGDGGDELFCGYHKYAFGQRFADLPARKALAATLGFVPWQIIERAASCFPSRQAKRVNTTNLRSLQRILSGRRPQDIAAVAAEIGREAERLVPNGRPRETVFTASRPEVLEAQYQPLAMLLDREAYLPDDVLTKVDRATMAVSLESRAPLLDHRLAEFSARLPQSYLVQGTETKRLLRAVLYRLIPRPLVDRPKRGFELPIAGWLRTELRPWALGLLASRKCDALLDLRYGRALFDLHLRGQRDIALPFWALLGFLAWAEQWL
jgi:asparagine synthase (glutamine-hydrolysing)